MFQNCVNSTNIAANYYPVSDAMVGKPGNFNEIRKFPSSCKVQV